MTNLPTICWGHLQGGKKGQQLSDFGFSSVYRIVSLRCFSWEEANKYVEGGVEKYWGGGEKRTTNVSGWQRQWARARAELVWAWGAKAPPPKGPKGPPKPSIGARKRGP